MIPFTSNLELSRSPRPVHLITKDDKVYSDPHLFQLVDHDYEITITRTGHVKMDVHDDTNRKIQWGNPYIAYP